MAPWSHRRALRPLAALAIVLLAACGDRREPTPTLTWYINPDNGGQSRLAERCSRETAGRFRIDVQILPAAADAQREQLVRRLARRDRAIGLTRLAPSL